MDLKEILLPSRSIEVAVVTEDDNHKPVILRLKTVIETGYDGGFFKVITPMNHGRLYNFQIDEMITVTFTTQNDQNRDAFDVKCRVVSRDHKGNLYTLTLRTVSEVDKVQRRQSFRVNVFNTYDFMYKGKTQQIVTKDISSTGMRGLTTMQMSKDDLFDIKFDANVKEREEVDPDVYQERIFTIQCRVIDCMPQTEIRRYMQRIQFVNMTPAQTKYLIQYLYAKQSEIIFTEGSDSDQRDAMERYLESQHSGNQLSEKDSNTLTLIGLISMFIFFLSLIFYLYAQPKPVYGLDVFFRYYRAHAWNPVYFILASLASLSNIFLSSYGLILNAAKIKNEEEHLSKILIVALAGSAILFLVLIYAFSTNTIFTQNKAY